MNICKEILKEHSKAQRTKIVDWVGNSQKRFNELFSLFLNDEYRVTQRAAWAVSYCVAGHPKFIKANFNKLLTNLQKPNLHDSIKRNSVRLLQHVDIPEKYQGEVMNICFQYLENPTEAVAIKAFSLTVLSNLAKQYPEIIHEVKLLIEEQLPLRSAAFKNRAKLFLLQFKL